MNNKFSIERASLPDPLESVEVKKTEAYGLKWAKAIQDEWFSRNSGSTCRFYDKQTQYHNLRKYARGEQDTSIYKKMLGVDGDMAYSNYDFRPIQVIPKFVKLIVNQNKERLFKVRAESTDRYSTDLRDKHRESLEKMRIAKPMLIDSKEMLGIDLMPMGAENIPDSEEETDLYMKLKYKPAIEIATEEAISNTLNLNNFEETQSRVLEDIATLGIGGVKHYTDPNKGIMSVYTDPADLVYSYPSSRNFKKVYYFGEVNRINISELKRLTGDKFSDDDIKDMAKTSRNWNNYHGRSNGRTTRNEDIEGTMIDVMHFCFKVTDKIVYKKKLQKNGGYRMTKKSSTFAKNNPNYKGYEVSSKNLEVWYEGSLVLGTDNIFNYKKCENMVKQKGQLDKTIAPYLLYAPDIYQNVTKSSVGTIIPYIDQMQQIHIKIQQMIAKARPNGIYINIDGLNEIDLGEGNFLTPLELLKIYDQTGNVLGTSLTEGGEYNYGREPIKELANGVIQGLDRLIASYNHYLNLVRDALGIPQGTDATAPHPDMGLGVQQQLALTSNTATRHILDGTLDITQRLCSALALRLKDIFIYSNLKEAYIQAIGKSNVDTLKAIKNYHLHDFGIFIELKPDAEEKQALEGNIQQALAKEQITLDDAIDIRGIGNLKLSNQLLKIRRQKREKEKRESEENMIKLNAEENAKAAERASQAKMMEYEMEAKGKMMLEDKTTEGKMALIDKEASAKSKLMEQEFIYNMKLRGIDAEALLNKESMKEDKKDKRQDRQNTHSSMIADQKANNRKPINFESSEDNISGQIEMSELDPK